MSVALAIYNPLSFRRLLDNQFCRGSIDVMMVDGVYDFATIQVRLPEALFSKYLSISSASSIQLVTGDRR